MEQRPTFLPAPDQELLLKACLFEGGDALSAWQAWRRCTTLEHVDIGSVRLLPLLAGRLLRSGVEEPAFDTYRGVERRTWARNQLLFHAAGLALTRLRRAEVPVMALKGVVLASTYYTTMSLRPMGDFDLLIRPVDGPKVFDLFEELGWRLTPGQIRPRRPFEFAARAASAFEDAANSEIQVDLHWRLLWGRCSAEAEAALWQRAVRFEIGGAECLAPCAADMLLHVCAHGVKWNRLPSLRWVVDAAFIIRGGAVDWRHLCAQGRRLGLSLPLLATLGYLRSVMHVPVPETVIADLSRFHVTSIERLLHDAQLQPSEQWSLLTALRIHRHIAWLELARLDGPIGYWRYFTALRRGRSPREVASWVRRRLARDVAA